MRSIFPVFLAIFLLVIPSQQGSALALSEIELKSSLNQMLDARILLLAVDLDELSSLQIKINAGEHSAAGLGNVMLQSDIRENENGHYIIITSREVVKEPVLNFTLELSWSKGHLLREYSLLIDPRH